LFEKIIIKNKLGLCIMTYFIRLGDIAQLGERLNGIQEVSGSTPLISTLKLKKEFIL
tara:strand:+ start:2360 stop:2530 length:171 start_codon:yes stop_codon:yes gene_type:complete